MPEPGPRPQRLEPPLVLLSARDGIATIVLNRPERYNAWTLEMMEAMQDALARCAGDPSVQAVILTGSGKYYCSGVDFGGAMRPMRPSMLKAMARDRNQALFDAFLDFPKPLFAAVNGPAIGASVTSAALCDAVVCAPGATFHTPFVALGIVPEGCSSINFPRLLGEEVGRAMLEEGRKLTAEEAVAAGLAREVAEEPGSLLARTEELARQWVQQGRKRRVAEDPEWHSSLKRANAEESAELAESFLRRPFLEAQYRFAAARGKTAPKLLFWTAKSLVPLVARL